jgi:hypothetical protein
MGKARLGVLLAGAYALGLVLLLVVAVSLPQGTVCAAIHRVPAAAHRAAALVRVAVRAGSLGMRHLPAALEPLSLHRHSVRFCSREAADGCGSTLSPVPLPAARRLPSVVVGLIMQDDS